MKYIGWRQNDLNAHAYLEALPAVQHAVVVDEQRL
jgi:hypothetical protein